MAGAQPTAPPDVPPPALPPASSIGLVAAGGAVGATARVALARWFPVADGAYPWTTFVENVTGAFALAVVAGLLLRRGTNRRLQLLVGTGALGAFTTYSTLALELDQLVAGGSPATAVGYAIASVVVGLAAAMLGLRIGHAGSRAPDRARPGAAP